MGNLGYQALSKNVLKSLARHGIQNWFHVGKAIGSSKPSQIYHEWVLWTIEIWMLYECFHRFRPIPEIYRNLGFAYLCGVFKAGWY